MAQKYVDRSEVLKKVRYVARTWGIYEDVGEKLTDKIKAIPAADVELVKHGEWNDLYGDYKVAKCSKCGEEYEVSDTNAGLAILFKAFEEYYKYCPRCGARMDGEEENA